MTNQERPVEDREELLDPTLLSTVATEEQEPPAQHDTAAEETLAPAEEPAPSANVEVEANQASAAVEPEVEPTAVEHATPDREIELGGNIVPTTEAEPLTDAAEPTAEAEPLTDAAEPTTEAELTTDAAEPTAEAELTTDAAEPTTEAELTTDAAEPTAEAELTTDAAELADTAASYTPVDETTGGRPRRVKDLEAGMELEGRVTSIALYGIFVDIGVGRDGLVHISEMSDTRIDSPSDLVQIGDPVKVRVKSVEPDGRRISLTMRSKERSEGRRGGRKKPDLNRDALSTLRVGDTVEGTVTGIAPFGVFVDIGVGKDGLVHISELSEGRIEKAEDAVQVGQSYTFKLLEVDAEGTRISLSLRRAQRAQRMQQLEQGQIIEGTISGLAPFGAFVDIGVGRDGLVHISELSSDRVNRVEDVVKVGDPVTVRVLEVDPQSKRISLTLRLEDRPADEAGAPREERAPRSEEPRQRREERGPREERTSRRTPGATSTPVLEVGGDDETEDAEGTSNATLEDLLTKYGNSGKRDRRRRREDEEEEGEGVDRGSRRQRDAIRRTIQQVREDE